MLCSWVNQLFRLGHFQQQTVCLPEGKPPFSYGFPMNFPFSYGFLKQQIGALPSALHRLMEPLIPSRTMTAQRPRGGRWLQHG